MIRRQSGADNTGDNQLTSRYSLTTVTFSARRYFGSSWRLVSGIWARGQGALQSARCIRAPLRPIFMVSQQVLTERPLGDCSMLSILITLAHPSLCAVRILESPNDAAATSPSAPAAKMASSCPLSALSFPPTVISIAPIAGPIIRVSP